MFGKSLKGILERLEDLDDPTHPIFVNDLNNVVQDIVLFIMDEHKNKSEQSNNPVLCKNCNRRCGNLEHGIMYCPVLSNSLRVHFKMKNMMYKVNHPYIEPPPGFTCPYGRAKKLGCPENIDCNVGVSCDKCFMYKSKNVQKNNTLDKLLHKSMTIGHGYTSMSNWNDIRDILTVLISYLIAKEKGE